jgi:transposase
MIRDHLDGIIIAIVLKATKARVEPMNPRIQGVKREACSFRTRDCFRATIYFPLRILEL